MNILTRLCLYSVLLFLVMACKDNQADPIDWKEVVTFIEAPIPANATNAEARWERGIDRMVQVRFEIPATNLPSLLTNFGFHEPLRENYRPFTNLNTHRENSWWNPDDFQSVLGATNIMDGKSYELIVTSTSREQKTIFLRVYEQ